MSKEDWGMATEMPKQAQDADSHVKENAEEMAEINAVKQDILKPNTFDHKDLALYHWKCFPKCFNFQYPSPKTWAEIKKYLLLTYIKRLH